MRILYVCDNLITFILNEIIELQSKNNEMIILTYHSELVFDVINKPILIEHGLDKSCFRFHKFNNRFQKYIYFLRKIIYDLFVQPKLAIKSILCILMNYPSLRFGIASYVDVRDIFGLEINMIHAPFSSPRVIDKVYLLSKVLNVPFTLSFRAHDLYKDHNIDQTLKRTSMLNKASQIITISNYNRGNIKNTFGLNQDIEVIHSSINPDNFRPVNMEKIHNSIIAVCRLSEEKGIIYLIEACHILNKRNINYNCTIIGDGPSNSEYVKHIHGRIDKLQIPNINFIGFLSNDEIQEHLNRSTVFVLPCIIAPGGMRDILSNALKEAMAMQVPVITSKICGIEELVDDGINGILVPPKEPAAIADAIEKVFNNPDLGNKMGEAGRDKIEKYFNVKIEALKLDNIFKKVVNLT